MTFERSPSSTPATPGIRVPAMAALAGAAWFLVHCLVVLFGPDERLMQWLYDDAFYYMITAKHFAEQHLSSFDGVTLTSGYHPLFMWLCAAVYKLHSQLDMTYVRLCMAVTLAIVTALLGLTIRHGIRHRNAGLLWAVALAATSYSALNNGLTVMEWPLVLLAWFLLYLIMSAPETTKPSRLLLGAFAVGVLGSFSRTDFGLVPASYLAAALLLGLRGKPWAAAVRAGAATAGALVALPLIFFYNYRMTGTWLQSSAEVKHLAASLYAPFNALPALWQFARVLLYLPPLNISPERRVYLLHVFLPILAAAAALALAAFVLLRKRIAASLPAAAPSLPRETLSLYAAGFAIAGYAALYGLNSLATFGWYTGAVTGFIVLVAARVFNRLSLPLAAAIVVPLMLVNIAAAQYFGGNSLGQMAEVWSGLALQRDHPQAVMGGGDVGKPSFYNDGRMFNLDGLMNNEVVPYLKAGRIHCYLLHRHIEYLYNIGSVAMPIDDLERVRHHEAPSPWDRYLTMIDAVPPPGSNPDHAGQYLKVNFDAIRNSGECTTEP